MYPLSFKAQVHFIMQNEFSSTSKVPIVFYFSRTVQNSSFPETRGNLLTVISHNIKTKLNCSSTTNWTFPFHRRQHGYQRGKHKIKTETQQDKHQINRRYTSCTLDSWGIHLSPKGSESPTPPALLPLDPTPSLGPALLGVWILTQWPFSGIGSPTQWGLYCNLDVPSTASCTAPLPHVGTLDHGTDGQTTDTLLALGLHIPFNPAAFMFIQLILGVWCFQALWQTQDIIWLFFFNLNCLTLCSVCWRTCCLWPWNSFNNVPILGSFLTNKFIFPQGGSFNGWYLASRTCSLLC